MKRSIGIRPPTGIPPIFRERTPGILPIFREPPPTDDEMDHTAEDVLSLPIWHVNASDASDVHPLTSKDDPLISVHGTQPEVINEIAQCLLKLNLPMNCVEMILEMAAIVVEFRAETFEHRRVNAPADEEYLRCMVAPLEQKELELLRPIAIIMEIVSHDQGWATNDQGQNGTYHGCWSWSEGFVSNDAEQTTSKRFAVCYNLRAQSTSRRHIRCITDPTILADLKTGAAVAMQLRAEYAGWANEAKYGRISILFAVGVVL